MSTDQKRKLAKGHRIDRAVMHRQWMFCNEVRQTLGLAPSPRPAYPHGRPKISVPLL